MTGEWAFRASVLGNDSALSGYIYLDPNGRAAYIADGVQIVGRGVGHWVKDSYGQAAAVELDIFQYAAASAVIPEKPHRFLGVWSLNGREGSMEGDWYFRPVPSEEPQLVGGFEAASSTMDLLQVALSSSRPSSDAPKVPASCLDSLMALLENQATTKGPSAGEQDPRLRPYTRGDIKDVQYIPDWISRDEEKEFMRLIDSDPYSWERMGTRSSQEWGAGDRCSCGRGLLRTPLPLWQQRLADALHHLGVFDGALYPMNSVRINGYDSGQGIFPHCDGPVYYPKVAILSMGAPCILSFWPRSGTEDCMQWDKDHDVPAGHRQGDQALESYLLEPRSLLLFGQDAFWHHRHGIEAVTADKVTDRVVNLDSVTSYQRGDEIPRVRRVSLTMRHLLPRCACQG